MTELRIDFETRSDVDLKKRGTGPYFKSPHWKALIACWSIDDGRVVEWEYRQPVPAELREALADPAVKLRGWNVSFERQCFEQQHLRHGWPLPAIERYRCTAAEAAAMALPRSLGDAAEALGLPVQKDKRGTALIRKFSLPRKPRKDEPEGLYFTEPEEDEEAFAEFIAYCRQDVATEAEAAKRIVRLSDYEQAVYTLDQVINARGIRIDTVSARAAIALAEKAKARLDGEMREITGGFVRKCSEPGRLVEWVQAQGVGLTSAAKAEITDLLTAPDVPDLVRKALEIRQEAAKTSVSKLQAMLARADADQRVRGSFIFCGASTGRWVSTGVNFANMPRPRKVYEDAEVDTSVLFDAFRNGDPDHLRFLYGDDLGRPLHLVSDAIRGFVWAAPGHELIQADYTGIEGVVIAWSSGEEWKVQALREINEDPSLPDMYRRTAAQIMNTTTEVITKKHPLRQSVGKVSELALGFGGGPSAFYSMSKNYGVALDPLFPPVWDTASEERREKAVKRWESCFKRGISSTKDISREAWLACELIKVGWRATNPAITDGWRLREEGMREAVRNPGQIVKVLKFQYLVSRGFLWARLPSGRCLAYGSPRLKDQVWAKLLLEDGTWSDSEIVERDVAERLAVKGRAKIERPAPQKVTALGVNAVTKKWERFALYGGLIAENDTQATARELLVNGMLKAEAAGYPIIAHVYDEIVAEKPIGTGSVEEFERIICELDPWADGIPLKASGYRAKRYHK